jgi:hypothetical protein
VAKIKKKSAQDKNPDTFVVISNYGTKTLIGNKGSGIGNIMSLLILI